jgi:CheY-like chemotaxis protein
MQHEKRVLVADDDPSIRQLLCTLIQREKVAVDCVADGGEAIEMIERHRYAAILLDLMMPRVDGFAVIEHLAAHTERESKPIVFVVSAYADERFKEVDSSVVAGVIHKPFDVSEIGGLIRHCVSGPDPGVPGAIEIRDGNFTIDSKAQRKRQH